MKLIHITPIYWDNWGYQENILAEFQAKLGNATIVIAPASSLATYRDDLSGKPTKYYLNNVKIIRLTLKWNFLNRFFWFNNLYNELEIEKPDIIMIHGLAMLPSLEVIQYKKNNPQCKIYADFHSDYQNSGKNFFSKNILQKGIWRYLVQKVMPHIEKIYYVRPSVKEFVCELYDIKNEKLEELLMGSELNDLSLIEREAIKNRILTKLNIPKDSFVLCTGGKIDKEKNLDVIINSMSAINNPLLHLIIFGKIDKSYVDTFNDIIHGQNNIHYIGWLNGNEVYDYFIASNISIFLGLHSVLWEQAVGCGTPIIFQYRKNREYLDLGGNCKYVFTNTWPELKQSLKILIEFPDLFLSMQKIAIEKGVTKFSYKKIINKLNESWGIKSN